MTDLYPTKARLALLRAVAAGAIFRGPDGSDRMSDGQRFSAAIAELNAAGWVELPAPPFSRWRLTNAGRAVLDAHGGAS